MRWTSDLLYVAAKLYYEDHATQAEVAAKLRTSRATVSRLLSEARRQGIVRIEVVAPTQRESGDLAAVLTEALGLTKVHLTAPLPAGTPTTALEDVMGSVLAPAVGRALLGVGLHAGDVLLVASGRTIYEVSRFDLPSLPGVVVAPTVGGTDQPEAWYQTNEITRRIAEKVGGRPSYLFAPALPGPELYRTLKADPAIQRVLNLWPHARAVLTGVGAPPVLRTDVPQFVDLTSSELVRAVGDVCSRFFDREGRPVDFGDDRLIALELETLRSLPVVIAVAVGETKVAPLVVAARAGYFTELVTDPGTAREILARL